MKCKRCSATIIGKFCHNCGTLNPDFSRRETFTFEELGDIFFKVPNAETIVDQCGENKIEAIKMYRDISGLGLKESKDAIDKAFYAKYPEKDPWSSPPLSVDALTFLGLCGYSQLDFQTKKILRDFAREKFPR